MDLGRTSGATRAIKDDALAGGQLMERWSSLVDAIERLAGATSHDDVVEILRSTARGIVMADGIAVVLRDAGFCHYVAEDAQAPLWAGQRFPAETCVSGWSMQQGETAAIPDVFADPRVPIEAYRRTFVRSLVMVPVGVPAVAAVGAYWAETRHAADHEIAMLEALARSAATALENLRLVGSLRDLNTTLEARVVERTGELEQTHDQLRQMQKLEIVGQLTGNVAHDFNNLLTPIISSLDLVLHRGVDDERLKRNITRALDAAERGRLLVQRLLAFARRQPLSPETVDLGELIEGLRELLASTVGPRITLIHELPPSLPPIRTDPNQLELAILNLAINARDAMSEGGTLHLIAMPLQPDARLPKGLTNGCYLCLEIRDSGTGMDAETLAHATEPFFSTKEIGHGTGLGLSMVDGVMAQLSGGMEIISAPGQGTCVRLYLPIAAGANRGLPSDADIGDAARASKGVALIIDDDSLVRAGTLEMLEEIGFDVIAAETADHGLGLIRKGLTPHIVVTDHLMPGMTGAELARTLKDERPDIPVLLISGYQHIETIAPDVPRLAKPFRHADLDSMVTSVMGHA